MKFFLIFLLSLFFLFSSASCFTPTDPSMPRIFSKHVSDSFELYIDLPKNYQPGKKHSVVFYMDANLKMGKEMRRQIRLATNELKLSNVIFVGVGHIGDYRRLRRRDFIPPVMGDNTVKISTDPDYGQADKFYSFLSEELIPHINKNYATDGRYSYVGHSFSGLFGFYCLLQPDPLFENYITISPSLWVNDNNIFRYYAAGTTHYPDSAILYHSCGSREWANRVRSSSRKMKMLLMTGNFPGLQYIYSEHQGKDHNGAVSPSLEFMFSNIRL